MRMDVHKLAVTVAAFAFAVLCGVATYQIQRNGNGLAATNAEVQRAARVLADYATAQTASLQSEKNQKAIDAGLALAASAQGSVRLFNTQTLPRVNKELDALNATTLALQSAVWEFKAAIAVNSQRTGELLSEGIGAAQELRGTAKGLNLLAERLQLSVPEIAGEIKGMIASGQASADQVNKLLADPNLPALLAQAERLLRETGDVMVNLDATTAQLPPIMATAKRWQNPLNVARIVSVLLGLL